MALKSFKIGRHYTITDKNGFSYLGRVLFQDDVKIVFEVQHTVDQNHAPVTAVAMTNPLSIELLDIASSDENNEEPS